MCSTTPSTDGTGDVARAAGAEVVLVTSRGKGEMWSGGMFADVEADIYVMADGDGTYDATAAPGLVDALITQHLDMVVGTRVPIGQGAEYRFGHRFGNRMLTGTVSRIFRRRIYRHALRLPGVLAALRQILPGAVEGL